MNDVFISYKSEEFEEADWVRRVLESNGISCWMAPSSITGGSSYAVEIPQAIRSCKVFVLILSKQAQESKWVSKEIDRAINENKIIMPFMLENCELKDDFNFYLTNVQRYAAYESKVKAVEKMVREIQAIINANKKDDEADENQRSDEKNTADEKPVDEKPVDEKKKVVTEKSKKPKKEKKPKSDKPKKDVKKILLSIVAAVAVIIALSVGVHFANQVEIAGEKFSKKDTRIFLEEKRLTYEDAENIAKIKKLSDIYLTDCEVNPNVVMTIFGNENINSVSLVNCGVTQETFDAAPLKAKLYSLDISGNPINDISFIAPASESLRILTFNNTQVLDISALEGFELRELHAANTKVSDLSALSSNEGLETLILDGSEITSLEALKDNENLSRIGVNSTAIADFTGLEGAIKLKNLYASSCGLDNLNGLQNTSVLYYVDLSNNNISDISVLSRSAATLYQCLLNDNDISDISALNGCSQLNTIELDSNSISSLEALSGCENLSTVRASNNKLTSAKGLESSKNIITLDLSNNEITDISAIKGIYSSNETNRLRLNLSNNKLTTFELPNIEFVYLALYGNDITDVAPIKNCKGSNLLLTYNENCDYSSLGENFGIKLNMLDCPLGERVGIQNALGEYNVSFIENEDVENIIGK